VNPTLWGRVILSFAIASELVGLGRAVLRRLAGAHGPSERRGANMSVRTTVHVMFPL